MSNSAPVSPPKSRSRPFDSAALGVPPPGRPQPGDQYADAFQQANVDLTFRLLWVTPEWAARVLAENNTRNRDLKPSLAVQLAATIRAGSWAVNGEPIIFSSEGVLLDGQHRLQAVVTSGVPVPCVAVFGVEERHFASLDGTPGRKRKDVLTIPREDGSREASPRTLAAALGWLYRWETGGMQSNGQTLANHETIPLLDRHPGIRESIAALSGRCTSRKHSHALFATLHYLFGQSDPAKRDDFFTQVLDRLNVKPGSVTAVLNRWLDNSVDGTTNLARGSAYTVTVAAVVVKAWNVFKAGLPTPKIFKFAPDEAFPTIL